MRRNVPHRLLVAAVATAGLLAAQPETSYLFRIHPPIAPAAHAVLAANHDLACAGRPGTPLEVVVMPHELRAFQALGLNAELVDRGRPFHERVLAAGPQGTPDAGYFTVAEIVAEMDRLVALHPLLAQRVDLSALPGARRTHGNQPLWALRVSDNVATDEDEPAIVLAAQHHARELNSPYVVIGAMNRILSGYATDAALRALVDGTELWFVPCVNPDGVDHVWNVDNLWRKNRRDNGGNVFGVDNNRNYPFLWGQCGASTSTSSETYRGPAAASEPETQTMLALHRAVRPEIYLDFHSSGREVLFPYAPCATPHAAISGLLHRYADDLRAPMSYDKRLPSGSGEAPEQHWADGGTMSFLTEISTSFQPPFTATQAEEARVWPGVRRALTAWAPALRGHVRSVHLGQPLAAEISYAPNPFSLGETVRGRARDGRFHAWLPLGTWQVTFRAAGHQAVTRTVVVTGYDAPQVLEIELEPAWGQATITATGSHRLGTTTSLQYDSPGDAGDAFWVAVALGTQPGIPIGSRTIPLNADALLFACATPGAVLTGNLGILPASAQATASLPIPPLPILVGMRLHAGGITLAAGYTGSVKKFSAATSLTIQP